MAGTPPARAARRKARRSSASSGGEVHARPDRVKIWSERAPCSAARPKASETPPATDSCAPSFTSRGSVDCPVPPRLVAEVLQPVVERVLHRVHHQDPERGRSAAERLVVPLPEIG